MSHSIGYGGMAWIPFQLITGFVCNPFLLQLEMPPEMLGGQGRSTVGRGIMKNPLCVCGNDQQGPNQYHSASWWKGIFGSDLMVWIQSIKSKLTYCR